MNPFLQNKNLLAAYALVWLVIALIQFILFNTVLNAEISFAIADSLIFNSIYMLLGLAIWYPTRFISFENTKVIRLISNHIAGMVITSALWLFAGYFILINVFPLRSDFVYSTLVWRFLIGALIYLILVAIYYLIIYYNNFRDKIIRENELSNLLKDSELKTLKYQINPHFIFNSLNSISSLTITEPKLAREMTIKLSDFLRGTLSKNQIQMNNLSDELKNIKIYTDIEKVRFGDKFEFIEEIDENCKSISVPNMLLQPLVENAIKYGVYESLEKVFIKVSCNKENNYFKIVVHNNFDNESVTGKGEGIGLKNISSRLKLIYQQDNLITTNKSENDFTVTIYIPNKEENK